MIKLMLNNKLYLKSLLFDHLENNNIPNIKIKELYKIYTEERNNDKVKKSDIITKTDIEKLLVIAHKLLKEVKILLR